MNFVESISRVKAGGNSKFLVSNINNFVIFLLSLMISAVVFHFLVHNIYLIVYIAILGSFFGPIALHSVFSLIAIILIPIIFPVSLYKMCLVMRASHYSISQPMARLVF